jgi:hypothetical protein
VNSRRYRTTPADQACGTILNRIDDEAGLDNLVPSCHPPALPCFLDLRSKHNHYRYLTVMLASGERHWDPMTNVILSIALINKFHISHEITTPARKGHGLACKDLG